LIAAAVVANFATFVDSDGRLAAANYGMSINSSTVQTRSSNDSLRLFPAPSNGNNACSRSCESFVTGTSAAITAAGGALRDVIGVRSAGICFQTSFWNVAIATLELV
jgi:hypothetical protein